MRPDYSGQEYFGDPKKAPIRLYEDDNCQGSIVGAYHMPRGSAGGATHYPRVNDEARSMVISELNGSSYGIDLI
jgi:hypothetical protein